ncbi:diguanylate cyclase/phosphodiesterase [Sphaerochaeta globosa str. Buddy]|uniref:Diguanylate cyclase/phosphodiesterase n=1 Tax=Sphaerochaeta globosa (strain ATCC BAA-1886 / DSM 22777 / Buddy) TaxID=158189 RepID=F0RYP0_SPHGB|nr:diguanylate cyclase/phosphodiesterase [Sphaerochaeta globosa str. Buddy]
MVGCKSRIKGSVNVQDFPKNKKNLNSWKSVIVPAILILMLFLAAGLLVVNSLSSFYYQERVQEASLLAKSYTSILSTVIDAEYQLDQQMESTLKVAGVTVSKYTLPFSNELLSTMAANLDVDVIYVYDNNLNITHSSDNNYIGWVSPPDHPISIFYESGQLFQAEVIRADTESGTLYKYGYYRFPQGGMVQVGILASNIKALYAQFEPQYIVERLSKDAKHTRLAYLDPERKVLAASDISLIGSVIQPDNVGLPISETSFSRISWEGTNYLALHLPITLKEAFAGSLVLFYDLSKMEQLILRLTVIIASALLVFYLLFAYSLFTVYRKNRRILSLAYLDELTGLPNLRNYHAYLEEIRCQHLALVVLNPLNFRLLNILYGYDHGDKVLINIAQHLRARSIAWEAMQPFRLSDDRFLLVIRDEESLEYLLSICQQLLNIKQETGLIGSIEVSIGLVQSIGPFHDATRLLKEALIALNATSPTHQIQVYNSELEERLVRADTIEQEIKAALHGDEGILSLVYQPIYDSDAAQIVSFEALARMKSKKLGSISPVEFIDIAEKRQLIIPLGKKILSIACDFINELQGLGIYDVSVAVNVSALQLMEEPFITYLLNLTKEKQIPLNQLEIELTESVFAKDIQFISSQLRELRNLGILISIDDFGTGYSSLSRLETLEIDYLKLDKSFVEKLKTNSENGFVSDIISLAHHIEKLVIAEGVETEEQESELQKLGCDYVQGYLYSRPVGREQALQLLEVGDA